VRTYSDSRTKLTHSSSNKHLFLDSSLRVQGASFNKGHNSSHHYSNLLPLLQRNSHHPCSANRRPQLKTRLLTKMQHHNLYLGLRTLKPPLNLLFSLHLANPSPNKAFSASNSLNRLNSSKCNKGNSQHTS
jgi:hypothetical protein